MRLVLAAAALALGPAGASAQFSCSPDHVLVKGDFGQARFAVVVADEPRETWQGLRRVEAMDTLQGMLFVFDAPSPRTFTMQDTLIPLDMLFAGPDGTIAVIQEAAPPGDPGPFRGGDAVQFVLEINGGLASRLGIAVGDAMQHPAIDAVGEAALPCG